MGADQYVSQSEATYVHLTCSVVQNTFQKYFNYRYQLFAMSQLTATLQIVESAHSRRSGNGVVVLIREVAGILGEFGKESRICEL